jgi:hypothetical protein
MTGMGPVLLICRSPTVLPQGDDTISNDEEWRVNSSGNDKPGMPESDPVRLKVAGPPSVPVAAATLAV